MDNAQVEQRISQDLAKVILNVTEWATDLLRDYIIRYVYQWGEKQKRLAKLTTNTADLDDTPNGQKPVYHDNLTYTTKLYSPREWGSTPASQGRATGQFLHSITYERMHADLQNYIGYMIFSDPSKMDWNSSTSLHGTLSSEDYRSTLIERLNNAIDDWEGPARKRWWTQRPAFFDLYLEELDRRIYSRFFDEMRKIGMKPEVTGISITAATRSTAMNERRAETWDF